MGIHFFTCLFQRSIIFVVEIFLRIWFSEFLKLCPDLQNNDKITLFIQGLMAYLILIVQLLTYPTYVLWLDLRLPIPYFKAVDKI